ncbi:hypothetical protein [Erythrobacter sp. F6033]|nr:hypothetical protein [Erythrobacter sp. F6033]
MTKAITLSRTAFESAHARRLEMVRGVIVLGCGVALILAGQPLPL